MSHKHWAAMESSLAAALAVVLAGPVAALAQGASVSAVAISARHTLLGEPLTGGAVGISFPRREMPVAFQFEAAHARSRAGRIGMACAGLILPETCPAERLRDEAWLTSASGGATLRVLRGRHALVALTADLTVASLRADTHGLSSGRALTATKMLWGGLIGAHAAWIPVARVPIALDIGGGIGGLTPIVHDDVVDGYTPFERGVDVRRVRLGLAWQP